MARFNMLCAMLLVGALGCSSSSSESVNTDGKPPESDVLGEVAGLISSYSGEFRKAPQKLGDLARYEPGYPLGFQALKSGDIEVVWGARMTIEEGSGTGYSGTTDVVAYQKQTPTGGGLVLLQNGDVKQMTAEEFKAAPKAK
jgi:hypothetical protein